MSDIVCGTLSAAEKIPAGTAVNLGTQERVRVIDAAEKVLHDTGHRAPIELRPEMPNVAAVERDCEATAMTQHYRCGLCVAPGDAQGLAQAILRLYADRTLARQMGQNARRAALAFDRRRHVRAYYDLFHNHTGVSRLAA